ncbi:putative aspartic-type endopeptidase opsB [Aphelenchoides bicaudatus]|nr:putative aspartic-type endopeptidase opsB [Aphelenchoides bicaudatus]
MVLSRLIVFGLVVTLLRKCAIPNRFQKKRKASIDFRFLIKKTMFRHFHEITVGTPPQPVKVSFDIGSSSIIGVLEVNCSDFDPKINYTNYNTSICYKNEVTYDPAKSKTNKKTGLLCDSECFGGPEIGEIMYDKFGIGNPNDKNYIALNEPLRFGSGRYTALSMHPIVGVSVPTDKKPDSNLFVEAWKQGKLENPVYSIHYRRCETESCEQAGALVLGGMDTENCEPIPAAYQMRCNNETREMPQFGVHQIQVVKADKTTHNILNKNEKMVHVELNTQVSLIGMPDAKVQEVYKFLEAESIDNNEAAILPCDSEEFEFKLIILGQEITIHSRDILDTKNEYKERPGYCYLNMFGTDFPGSTGGKYLIGQGVLLQQCIFVDFKDSFIGFSPIKNL